MTKAPATTIEAYIAGCPEVARSTLVLLRSVVREEAPESAESISYGMPTFSLDGKVLIYIGAWKSHIALYPTTDALLAEIPELAGYIRSKATMQFPYKQPLPLDLIRRIVAVRVGEVRGQQAG